MKTVDIVSILFLLVVAAMVAFSAVGKDSRILFFAALVLFGSVCGLRKRKS